MNAFPASEPGCDRQETGLMRLLILAITSQFDESLAAVLERIPPSLVNNPSVDFLFIDDTVEENNADVLDQWLQERDCHNLQMFRHSISEGGGENQKLGYVTALEGGYNSVIFCRGDKHSMPDHLPSFIELWESTRADVALGTPAAQTVDGTTLPLLHRGGMANRLLTWAQNRLTGFSLLNYDNGYRGYRVSLLRRIKFELNANDDLFDTEILLQAVQVGASISELPVVQDSPLPHPVGPGFSRVIRAISATIHFKLHEMGVFCSLRYRRTHLSPYLDKTTALYSSHRMALTQVAAVQPGKLLDIGCGPGHVARRCEEMGVRVTGIDRSPVPDGVMSEFHRADLEVDRLQIDLCDYDMVLLLDILEHLTEPEQFLLNLRKNYTASDLENEAPQMIISTPNVAFIGIRLNLLLGRFSYAERGILDITHCRLFTRSSLIRMLRECGFELERVQAVPVPFERVIGGRLGILLGWLGNLLALVWPTLFAFQFMAICKPKPSVGQLLTRLQRPPDKMSG